MIKSICILGGGNAGLMTALMLRVAFPLLEIKLIKSSKIPTIGVGEGSTEHWVMFADMVGITTKDIVDHAGATIKHGIQFNNWTHDGDLFFHSLPEFLSSQDRFSGLPYNLMHLVSKNFPSKDLVWNMSKEGYVVDPCYASSSQYHFDSLKLNSYLEKISKERNIEIIEDTIVDVSLTEAGYVNELTGEKAKYTADFFIDNSGFERVISKKLSIEWKPYSKFLPVNAAFAFPSKEEQDIFTHTHINGRTHGWSWKAPVQGRHGNGYVYCSDFTSLDIAVEEIQKDYLEKINIVKEVKFVAGHIDKFWFKNCVSMGLAGSFIEPLEASNIATTIQQCRLLISSLICWTPNDQYIEKHYNKTFDQVSQNILDYVQLHYLNGRTDSDFWKWCQHEMILTDFNKETLEYFKNNFVSYNFFHNNIYELYDELDWIQLMHGLKMFNVEKIGQIYSKCFYHLNDQTLHELSSVVNAENTKFYKHREAIQVIKDWKND